MAKNTPDTVPGLGFKDKEKAVETLKILEGRDPDYQKLAIKGLIGRAKRTLTLTKAEDKIQNINDALKVFEKWLDEFDKLGKSKLNRPYLPLETIKVFLPLKDRYKISDDKVGKFIAAYESAGGDYKHLRTVESENETTWDIVRNKMLEKYHIDLEKNTTELWDKELPSKEHLKVILWGYSPQASKIKKSLPSIKKLIGGDGSSEEESDEEVEESPKKSKRRSSSSDDGAKKKKRV